MIPLRLRLIGLSLAIALPATAADLDREIILAPHAGSASEDAAIVRWQEKVRESATADAFHRLAWAYVAKARRTLDSGYYKLAERTVEVTDKQFGASPESRLLRGHALHNLHHFKAAETVARQLVAERGAPADWALLSDVLIEQGRTADGADALQTMVNLKPGADAYSRIAHVRWLKGDRAGAVASLEIALRSTHVHDVETRAWVLSRLSFLQLQQGDFRSALERAQQAETLAADYAPALLARGRALVALERLEEAITPLTQAEHLQPLPEYQWWLADVHRATGRQDDALRVEERLKRRGADSDARTLALYLATRGETPDRAVRLAESELAQRGDGFTHDALAWALRAAGRTEQAKAHLAHVNTGRAIDARLSWHAGEIELATGNVESAEHHFADARALAGTLTPSERALLARRAAMSDVATR